MPETGQAVWCAMEIDSSEFDVGDEPMGTKEKFWIDLGVNRWLVKLCRVVDGRVLGEDWAEWLVHRLASLLGVPTAVAEPARVRALGGYRRGIASRDVREERALRLVHGNELLAEADEWYDPNARRENPRYTVAAVRRALGGVEAPRGLPAPVQGAFDAWVGYLVLDAWVAGRDRHHENWAVVRTARTARLVPSFDHGNALGFQETEAAVSRMADDATSMERWARRGSSHHFAGRPGLVTLAHEGLALACEDVRAYWLQRIGAVSASDVATLVAAVPSDLMSQARCTFITTLLETNRRRLTDGDS